MPDAAETLVNLTAATMVGGRYGLIPDAAVALSGDRIVWIGPRRDAPRGPQTDLGGRLVTPALIDCHTHVVHGGHRAAEFEQRLLGATTTRSRGPGAASSRPSGQRGRHRVEELVASALPRIDAMLAGGAGTIEIKSGYGLDVETELRMLRAAPGHRRAAAGDGEDELSGRACHSAGISGPRRCLYRRCLHPRASCRPCRGSGRCSGRVLRRNSVQLQSDRARF